LSDKVFLIADGTVPLWRDDEYQSGNRIGQHSRTLYGARRSVIEYRK